jgi:hypothetical protein
MAKAQVLTSGSIGSNTELLGESTGAKRTITITQPAAMCSVVVNRHTESDDTT